MEYKPVDFETKWREKWLKDKIYSAGLIDSNTRKFYSLYSFPYPSGDGLHVGHVEGMVANDIVARYYRMKGFTSILPMGWDGFGLPAENFAIKTGVHPHIKTEQSVANFIDQINKVGIGVDWDKEVGTHRADYYKWTQWIFLQLYKKGLAYKKLAPVNWCPKDQTVLANEQVIDGKCERCDTAVEQKEMSQWFFKITDFADRLDKDLERVDWPEGTKQQQRNWIGKSEGTKVRFKIEGEFTPAFSGELEIFTTRLDTIFGCTFLVVSPENQIIEKYKDVIRNISDVREYAKSAKNKTDLERQMQKDKTGVELKGIKAVNPFNLDRLPIFVADYVLNSYGTGAIMAVPAHDERDNEFALKYNLPVFPVISMEFGDQKPNEQFVDGVSLVLFNKQSGKYGFVKHKSGFIGLVSGGTNDKEDYYQTAKRELMEETGLWDYESIHKLGDAVYAHYWHSGKQINRFAKTQGLIVILNSEAKKEVKLEDHEKGFELVWLSPEEIIESYNVEGTKHWREILLRGVKLARYLGLDSSTLIVNYSENLFTGKGILTNSFSKPFRFNYAKSVVLIKDSNQALTDLEQLQKEHPQNFNIAGYWQGIDLFKTEDSLFIVCYDFKEKDELFTKFNSLNIKWENVFEYLSSSEIYGFSDQFTKQPVNAINLTKSEIELLEFVFSKAEIDYSGKSSDTATQEMQEWLLKNGLGEKTVSYKLRDWLVSRQRYWGAPIPIVYDPEGKAYPLKEEDLPLLLPEDVDFKPTGESPIKASKTFKQLAEAKYGKGWYFESDTMDTFVDSSWYFLRYIEAKNDSEIFTMPEFLPSVINSASNDLLYKVLQTLIERFTEQKVDYAVFGSVAVALLNRSPHKELGDIDFFVSKNSIDTAKEILESLGFKFESQSDNLYVTLKNNQKGRILAFKKGALEVELLEVEWDKTIWEKRVLVPFNNSIAYIAPLNSLIAHYKRRENTKLIDFLETQNTQANLWLPSDLYIIGTEHTVLHLLYSRFFTKFFFDSGFINFDEPFYKMRHMGLILGPDGKKMSKRWGNVINPTDEVNTFGADTLRMYEMFMGPFEEPKPWNNRAENGVFRFLKKVWELKDKVKAEIINPDAAKKQEIALHKLIKKVSSDIENLSFNTSVAKFMETANYLGEFDYVSKELFEILIKLLAPFAPFITEELWSILGNSYSIHQSSWPEAREELLKEETVKIAVQINGKVRGTIEVSLEALEEEVMAIAKGEKNIAKYLEGGIKKIIYVKGKVLNIVV